MYTKRNAGQPNFVKLVCYYFGLLGGAIGQTIPPRVKCVISIKWAFNGASKQ